MSLVLELEKGELKRVKTRNVFVAAAAAAAWTVMKQEAKDNERREKTRETFAKETVGEAGQKRKRSTLIIISESLNP